MRLGLATLVFLVAASSAAAAPWMDPGDTRLRHHVQVLSDAALIRVPVNTWPLMWSGVMDELGLIRGKVLNPSQRRAVDYISQSFNRQTSRIHHRLAGRAGEQLDPVRGFGDTRRSERAAEVTSEYIGNAWAGRLQVSSADDPVDSQQYRYDGSYIAGLWGNWAFSFGSLDRWWGPAWESALILSSNPRPIPGVALQRNSSEPFDNRFLRWLGPWQLVAFAGELEEDRAVANAKLLGMRVNFRPASWLELGLSRTAQWGGEGRPQSLDSLLDVVVGNDNTDGGGITRANEPSNQLAGVDWRASWSGVDSTLAFYGEVVGEDEAGGLPSRRIVTLGADATFYIGENEFRVYLEASDTASERRYATARYQYTYEHGTYQSGYRYRGRVIGASVDNDSRAHHLALQWYPDTRQSIVVKISELDFRPNAQGADSVSNSGSYGYAAKMEYQYRGRHVDYAIAYRHYDGRLILDNVDTADDALELSVSFNL